MMKYVDYYKNTEVEKGGRGADLQRVDRCFKRAEPLAADKDEATAQLSALLSAIYTWFEVKVAKHGEKRSDNATKRMKVMTQLKLEVIAELKLLSTDWDQITKSSLAFAKHKVGGQSKTLRGLDDGYAHERKQFTIAKKDTTLQKSEKLTPYSASYVSDAIKNASAYPGLSEELKGIKFSKMSFKEFGQTWQSSQTAGVTGANEPSVHFLRKNERLGFLAWVENGKFYKNAKIEYSTPKSQPDMYAMDKYGNLITMRSGVYFDLTTMKTTSKAIPGAKVAQYNHSSLNAGADVICAGLVGFDQGLITYIDNESGHYKPTPKDLQNAVRSLHEADSADLKKLEIKVYVHDGKGGVQELHFKNYNVFLDAKF